MTPSQRWRYRASKLLRHPAPLRFVASRVLWRSGLSSFFTVRLEDGVRLRFHPSAISASLWADPDGRSEDADFLRMTLRPGDRYVDCGANVGHLALVGWRCVAPRGEVLAVEANPRLHAFMTANLALNGADSVRAVHAAVGDRVGEIHVSDRHDDDQNRVGDEGLKVRMSPLDSLVSGTRVTLLKIDVEGYELPTLNGARSTLERTDVVYCELSRSNCGRFGYSPTDVEDLLAASGFAFLERRGTEFFEAHGGIFAGLTESDQPATGYNLVAVRRGFLPEFGRRIAERGYRLVVGEA